MQCLIVDYLRFAIDSQRSMKRAIAVRFIAGENRNEGKYRLGDAIAAAICPIIT
ncbi:MAG: hypothetical protein AAGA60_28835 [Cyanobacteria bacterium P01_E01_bin.42]